MASDGSGKESFVPLARHGKAFLGDKPSLSQTPLGKQFPSCLLSKPWGQDSFILYFSERLSLSEGHACLDMPYLNSFLPLTPPPSCSPFKMVFITLPGPAVQETHIRSLGQEDPLEEGLAIHSSILAWRIPWTEEPGSSSPWGARVRHDWRLSTRNTSYYLKSSHYLFALSLNSIWRLHKGLWQTAQTSPLGSAENQDNYYVVLMIKYGK